MPRTKKQPEIDKSEVYAAMAMMISSVAIGRALSDDELTTDLLSSCRESVLKLLKLCQ